MSEIDTCKKCKNRKLDLKQGIVCNLTGAKPDFEDTCAVFIQDETIQDYKGLNLKPNTERAKIAIVLIWIVLFFEVLVLISNGFQYDLLNTVSNGGEVTAQAANSNDFRQQFISIMYLIAYVISGITFILWFRRAYYNLHQKVDSLKYSEGWAAGAWFTPIVNLYYPYQIMKELYVETKNNLLKKNNSLEVDLETNLLGIWWGLWVANGILGQIIFRFSKNAETVSELMTFTLFNIISSFLGIALVFITIPIIKKYAKVESLLVEN